VFNMGHRLEVYTDAATAGEIVKIAESFQIDARIIGRVEAFEGNKLTLATSEGQFEYIG
jgi:phosphoribosylformylglycinamidine cyclo-ligase